MNITRTTLCATTYQTINITLVSIAHVQGLPGCDHPPDDVHPAGQHQQLPTAGRLHQGKTQHRTLLTQLFIGQNYFPKLCQYTKYRASKDNPPTPSSAAIYSTVPHLYYLSLWILLGAIYSTSSIISISMDSPLSPFFYIKVTPFPRNYSSSLC
jgi:hypothetical protein